MDSERVMILIAAISIITNLLWFGSQCKQLGKGKKQTYDTALERVFYVFILPVSLAIFSLGIAGGCISRLTSQEEIPGLMSFISLFIRYPVALYAISTIGITLYIWSLVHSIRRYNTSANIMYWMHVVNIALILAAGEFGNRIC